MAPEGLDKDSRIVEKTDLYSFAVTVLFLMFPEKLALNLLFLPISEDLETFFGSLIRFPLLDLIFKSLRCDPVKRVALRSWRNVLEKMKNLDKNMLIEKISSKNLETKLQSWYTCLSNILCAKENEAILNPLNRALKNESGFVMDVNEVNKKEAWVMSKAISHVQKLSSIYCDPEFSLLSKGLILIGH